MSAPSACFKSFHSSSLCAGGEAVLLFCISRFPFHLRFSTTKTNLSFHIIFGKPYQQATEPSTATVSKYLRLSTIMLLIKLTDFKQPVVYSQISVETVKHYIGVVSSRAASFDDAMQGFSES